MGGLPRLHRDKIAVEDLAVAARPDDLAGAQT
jgi:hypothetical protein